MAVLAIGAPIAYLVMRLVKLHSKPIAIADVKRQTNLALLMIVAGITIGLVWRSFVFAVYVPGLQLGNHFVNGGQTVDGYDLLAYLVAYVVIVFPSAIAIRRTRQSLETIGVTRANIRPMLALGLSLSLIYSIIISLVQSVLSGLTFIGFSPTLAYAFVLFTMVGFFEEGLWRGYLQTRMVARYGAMKGLVATSLMFALWHSIRAFDATGEVFSAVAFGSLRFFPSLLFGYIMYRSQNILPSSIVHLFYDWSIFFWK